MKTIATSKFWKIIVLALGIGLLFGYSVGSLLQSNDRSDAILKELKNASECTEVNQIIYAKGVQFGKEGISTEKGEYQLVGCEFVSVKEEAKRLNMILNNKVKGFEKVDLIELEFIHNNEHKTIIIKNGKIK